MFYITPQRSDYLNARGKIVLNACPGSGKTTCIINKLPLLEKDCLENYGAYSGIACLSFTNVAKNEILQKYLNLYGHSFRYPHLVSTIDSFINQYITLPFYNLFQNNKIRPSIIDRDGIIDSLLSRRYQTNGEWKTGILYPMSTFKDKKGRALYHSYPAGKIWIDINGNYTFEGKMPSTSVVDHSVFKNYGEAIFDWKIKNGYITSHDSGFIALQILKTSENVGKWLIQRFPYIIIDEAQDNSEIQHAIFDKLIEYGLQNIELIGDPYQSLYEWREAKPQFFINKYQSSEWLGLPLSQNRRSVQRIIDCFSMLRNANDPDIVAIDVEDKNIPLIIYKYNETNPTSIVNDFEQKCIDYELHQKHIVVRGSKLLDKMLGRSADINPWKSTLPTEILRIKHLFEINSIKEAIDRLRKIVIEFLNADCSHGELVKINKEKQVDSQFNSQLYGFISFIPATTETIQNWTDQCIIEFRNNFGIEVGESFEFKFKINGYKMAELKMQPLSNYFNKPASSKLNIPLTTIHQIKGATLDAILYVLDESSIGQSVSFNDFTRPSNFPTEKQRMIYVACSRPRQLLALALPHTIPDLKLQQKFGNDIHILNI